MAFWEGFSDSFFREANRAVERERQRELDEQNRQRFKWEQEQQAQAAKLLGLQQKLADDLQYGAVDTSGVDAAQVSQATGITAPRVEEMARTNPQAFDPMAGPALPGATRRGLTPKETADRIAALAALKGDYAGLTAAQDRAARLERDAARQAEFKRLQGMKDDEIAQLFKETNADGSGVPAMVDFDPKTRKFLLVSQVPGVPSQTLSRAEMLQGLMSAWEAGNGDYTQGIKALVESAQNQRALRNQDFERSTALAKANADAYFRGLAADNDAARTSIARQGLGLQRGAAAAADWLPVGVTDDKRGLVFYNRRTRKMETESVPAGVDAVTWFRRITGEGAPKPFNPTDYANAVKSFADAGMPLEEARMQADQLFGRAPAATPQAVLEVLKNMDRQAGQQRGAAPTVPAPPAPQGVNARLGVPTPELERLVREGRAPSARPDWSQVKPQGVPYGLPGWRLTQ
ncbi:hypothetical protein [Schlegelella aquatica]|uniref:hypothetical protein n=1 Tax=Caldimonas aquatica TaxID=376175 RepID=UPI003750FB02